MSKFATTRGTQQYKEDSKEKHISNSHFSEFDEITFSGLGMGSYLGDMNPKTDKNVENAVVDSVLSGSINILDTAINYRNQLAERSIARGIDRLKQRGITRDQVFVSTKNGYIPGDADKHYSSADYLEKELLSNDVVNRAQVVDGIHCMDPEFLSHQLDQSLLNLGIPAIDLLYLHNAVESQQPKIGKETFLERLEQSFEFFEQARNDGKIKYYGMATWDCFRVPENHPKHINLETVVNIAEDVSGQDHGFKFIQLPINLALPEAMTKEYQVKEEQNMILLQAATELGIGIFSSVPLMQTKLLSYELPDIEDHTKAQVCLEFIRSIPEIIASLVGHKNPQHVKENVELGKLPRLSVDKYRQIYFQ